MHKRIRTLSGHPQRKNGPPGFCWPEVSYSARQYATPARKQKRMPKQWRRRECGERKAISNRPCAKLRFAKGYQSFVSWRQKAIFPVLPMNIGELKVSFALQKIPLTMNRGDSDATLSIG